MQLGDFTKLAHEYVNRPGYCPKALRMLALYIQAGRGEIRFADIGAGTGKLTEGLLALGLRGDAVEPNDAMREQGIVAVGNSDRVLWRKGSAEETGLKNESVDWALMGSSFHWTDPARSLPEFHRILKPGGYFTAVWNPRDLERSELQKEIDKMFSDAAPEMKRVSSGAAKYTGDLVDVLPSTGHFDRPVFVESTHIEIMSKERYLGAWRSVNDIQAQLGIERFNSVLKRVEERLQGLDSVPVPYKTRAWTARVLKG